MAGPKLKVVLTRKLPSDIETRMRELFDCADGGLNGDDHAFTVGELRSALGRADVLVPTITDRIDAKVLESAGPNLKLIANFGAGIDHIDVAAAVARGIVVSNTPGVLTEDTADIAMALILAVARRIVEGADLVQRGDFRGWTPTSMSGTRVFGKRLGIVGMGRIGQALARRAAAFGLSVHYHNRKPVSVRIEEELSATYWDDLDQMLPRVDFLSINCPKTEATHRLLSAQRLALLKPSAILVNTARGEIVDEAALAAMLKTGTLAGAGLDVYEREPQINPALMGLPNVVLLPHMASASHEARLDMGERVILNIKTFQDGHRPPDRVIPAML
ncbi:MAG TPA: D-glycerate dehydrogenase [Caulobacteraceae bacterium]|jgi:glyoxylate reductase|nr:D-glycerate dehydrogenase [Caulobacteraceae bacterium]